MSRVTLALVFFSSLSAFAWAIDRPPQQTGLQKAWLEGKLGVDMRAQGMFTDGDYYQAERSLRAVKSRDLHSLADLYYLTRNQAERDMQEQRALQAAPNPVQPNMPQVNPASPNQARAVQAQPALLPANPGQPTEAEQQKAKEEREELKNLCARLPKGRGPVQVLSQLIYATLPGWCAQQAGGSVPSSYYANGSYVGPLASAGYAGPYTVNVYDAYVDSSSYFHRFIDPRKSFRATPFLSNGAAPLRNPNGTFVRNPAFMPSRGTNPAWVRPPVFVRPMVPTTGNTTSRNANH